MARQRRHHGRADEDAVPVPQRKAGSSVPRPGRAAFLGIAAAMGLGLAAAPAPAQTDPRGADHRVPALNTFGMPGLIDTPTAVPLPDGTIAFSLSGLPGTFRSTLAFQITPWLTGSFRYSGIERPRLGDTLYDRSFDLQMRLLREGGWWPAVSLGLRDFIGTGEYSSEYIVATRQVTPQLRLTAGLGWGRMASGDGFTNPLGNLDRRFRTRPDGFTGEGGRLEVDRFFRGDAVVIAGVEWQVTDRLRLMAEFSGDAYRNETEGPGASWRRRSPVNIGASWQVGERTALSGFVLHGDTVGFVASVALNPNRPLQPIQLQAPVPVAARPDPAVAPAVWGTDWAAAPQTRTALRTALASRFEAEGLRLQNLTLEPQRAVVRLTNLRHEAPARAIGRAARIMTVVMPASVEEFVLISTARGMDVSAVTLRRSDLEALEHAPDGSAALRARAAITDPAALPDAPGLLTPHPPEVPRLGWSLLPYVQPTIMDPTSPLRIDAGVRAEARYSLADNVLVSGSVTQRVVGNLRGTTRAEEACRSDGFCYERVRSDAPLYSSSGPVIERLTVEHFSRPGESLFARVSAGWLERMYAGVSAELLWKPVDSRIALGAEVNRVGRRAPSSAVGLTDYEVTTGHVSAYYDFGGGFLGQVDVGQYLAGDRGATVALSREFASGWMLGAYATLTDMPFSAFGEGSFDKGITITIPVTWFDGRPTRARSSQTIRSLQRDGGARLEVTNRLYPMVRDLHSRNLDASWGTVWQ